MMTLVSVLVAVALVAVAIYFARRTKPYSTSNLVLRGAIKSIMEGEAHPGMRKFLVPIPNVKMSTPPPSQDDEETQRKAGDDAVTKVSAVASLGEAPTLPKGKEKDLTDPPDTSKVPRNIFREYDIRGLVDSELSASLMKKIGLAIGSIVARQGRTSFLVGSDNRLSGPKLLEQLIKGLGNAGLKITNVGTVPTPVLYYSVHKYSIPDGIMLTGSHNGYEYNGCKIIMNGATMKSDDIQGIYDTIMANDYVRARGSLVTANPFSDYIKQLLEIFSDLKTDFHVAVDCAHGVTGAYIPFILRKLGCNVTELACSLDQHQASHAPDPTVVSHLEDLQNCIRQANGEIDLGLAYDGDGDRLVVIDNTGNIIWPDRLLMLFAQYALEQEPGGTVVYDVKCSSSLEPWITKHGGKPLMWKTGHSLMRHKMNEVSAVLAGELSGHIFWKEWHGFDDAIYSSCRLLDILTRHGKKLSDIFADIPGGSASPEYRINMKNDTRAGEIVRQMRQLCDGLNAKIVEIDGVRIEYDDRWGIVRPSNTSPVLVCRFEGDDDDKLAAIQKEIRELLHQVDDTLDIPF